MKRLFETACQTWTANAQEPALLRRLASLPELLASVVALDDATITFSNPISGLTADPEATLAELFRLYAGQTEDETAWNANLAQREAPVMAFPTFNDAKAILDLRHGVERLRRHLAEAARADDPSITDETLDQEWRLFATQLVIPIDGATSAVLTKPRGE